MITETELVKKVRTLLNEAEQEGVSLITGDTLLLDKHIAVLLPEAVLFIQMNKAQGVLNAKSLANCTLKVDGDGGAVVQLPDDYIRLVSIKVDSWKRPCTKSYPQGSVIANLQCDKYMRTGNYSPVCIEGADAAGCLTLKLYPAETASVVESLLYEARYNASEGLAGGCEPLIKAVAYQCAALVCSVYERHDTANVFLSLAAALCNNDKM